MNKKDNDILEELFRSRLQHLEADPDPDDWNQIASRLPDGQTPLQRPLRHRLRYWAAAVAVALVLVTGTIYVTQHHTPDRHITETIRQETQKIEPQAHPEAPSVAEPARQEIAPVAATPTRPATPAGKRIAATIPVKEKAEEVPAIQPFTAQTEPGVRTEKAPVELITESATRAQTITGEVVQATDSNPSFIADAATDQPATTTKNRRWGFGMGGGSITAGSDNVVNGLALRTSHAEEEDAPETDGLPLLNATSNYKKAPKTNIKHKTPVSVGFSVSYYLTDRLSLQSGLTYSMVTSDWDQMADPYYYRTRQRLHFIGIPLSASYKIAEWQRLQVYAGAGATTQLNVKGKRVVKMYSGDELLSVTDENERMKRLLWSVNARAGVSYPVFRYVSAFAEVGGAYYFDNGSEIETIYSDKPFNVSFNFGLRLNF